MVWLAAFSGASEGFGNCGHVSGVTVAEEFLSCPLDETCQGVEGREFV